MKARGMALAKETEELDPMLHPGSPLGMAIVNSDHLTNVLLQRALQGKKVSVDDLYEGTAPAGEFDEWSLPLGEASRAFAVSLQWMADQGTESTNKLDDPSDGRRPKVDLIKEAE